jgi:membrane protease YdiL (CAAX protease family)
MISFHEQAATILEFALVFGGLGFLAWLFLSSAGRVVRASPAVLPAWDVTMTDFLFLAWLVVTLGFLGQILLRLLAGHAFHNLPEGGTLELVFYGSMFHVGAILAWLCFHLLSRRRRFLEGRSESPRMRASLRESVRGAAMTFLAVIPLVTGAGLLWERLLMVAGLPTARQELVDYFTQAQSPLLLVLMIVLALFVAPISEEMVFRAGLFRYLRTRVPRWVAFTVSAGLFALPHMNWISFLPLFILGVVFAAAYERTGRITVPMLAHAFFNLNSLLLVLSSAGQ